MANIYDTNVAQDPDGNAQKVIRHFRCRSNAGRLFQWAEGYQPTSCRQSADISNDGSQASEQNAQQDIRHLRIRCDDERLALMGRAEPEDCRSPLTLRPPNLRPPKLASLDNTVAVSGLQSFSESQKTRPFHPPQPHRGHNRLRSQSVVRASSLESES